jgi:hypothetical protein
MRPTLSPGLMMSTKKLCFPGFVLVLVSHSIAYARILLEAIPPHTVIAGEHAANLCQEDKYEARVP